DRNGAGVQTCALPILIVGPLVTVLWCFFPPLDIYEGGPAFIAALLVIVLVSLFTQPPEGEDFDRMWDVYTEKSELGRPVPLPSRADERRVGRGHEAE